MKKENDSLFAFTRYSREESTIICTLVQYKNTTKKNAISLVLEDEMRRNEGKQHYWLV